MNTRETHLKLTEIFESDKTDLVKLILSFDLITTTYVHHGENEIEVLQALKDEENLIKERIKTGMMKTARGIFNDCVLKITGEEAWEGERNEL